MAGQARTEYFRGPLMRISFAQNLLKEREQEKDDGSKKKEWGCTLILPSDDAGWGLIQNAIAQVLQEKGWVERFKNELIRNPIIDGGSKSGRSTKTGEFHPGMGPGVKFIRAKSNDPIRVFNKDLVPITEPRDCPSGWWGYPAINAYSWGPHPKNGEGVSIGTTKFFEKVDTGAGAPPKDAANLFG